jgi:DNA-binding CsgD family transcriptional regulator
MLVGRSAECGALDRLLAGGRHRRSGAIVLRGEPGVGKTALLAYAEEQADGFLVLRGTGIENESDLAFAALHQLLARDLDRLDCLPDPQADALRGAFGLAPAPGTDPFLIALAALGLLAELAEEAPVLCLVDDAQWVDNPSANILLFTARRIEAEGIVFVFGAREGDDRRFEAPGLPSLPVEGLDAAASVELLDRSASALSPAVRDRLVEQVGGNPLALLELPSTLSEEQLSGREPLAEPLPIGSELQASYLARVRRLPEGTQSLLLVAAAEDSGSVATILRAAGSLGVARDELAPAERDGLVAVADGQLTFRHPLVRSAIYRGCTFHERQAAHTALADAQDGANSDRRAWHRAAAAEGPDEEIAGELEAAARRSRERGGYTAAASALERAASLTPDERRRTARLIAAADAAWLVGKTPRARALLADASVAAPADLKVDVTKLQGRLEVRSGVFAEATAMLLTAGQALATADPETAMTLLREAEEATLYTGDVAAIVEIGAAAAEIVAADPPGVDLTTARVLEGIGLQMSGRFDEATALLQEALPAGTTSEDLDEIVYSTRVASGLGDDITALEFCNRALRLARERGAVGALPRILERAPFYEIRLGRYTSARVHAAEGLRLARELTQEPGVHLSELALVAAIQGREDECRTCASEASARAVERRSGLLASLAGWAVGLLELGLGRPEEAAAALGAVLPGENVLTHTIIALFLTPDYIEATARAGRHDTAVATLRPFEEWASSVDQPWALALAAHCRGLVSEGDEAEDHLSTALRLHPAIRPFEHARTELALGEVLRRNRKRREAREHLRSALATFEQLGAAPWEERARNELRASGETARRRDPSTLGELTPQELQIARAVASGARNREVAAQLFLSPRTIDYHLRKVFMKLGISSRAELAQLDIGVEGRTPAAV